LWFHKDPEKRYRFVTKTNKIWGRHILWGAASKVNVIYKNEAVKKEVEKIRDTREAIVLISNHQSNTDIPVLSAYLPIDFSFIAKKEMRKWPLIGYWMKCQDCIFLDRKNPRQGMKDMKEAEKKIANGHSFVIFPEGTRSEDGKVGEFKKGSFKLALDSNARILPVTLIGTYDIQKNITNSIQSLLLCLLRQNRTMQARREFYRREPSFCSALLRVADSVSGRWHDDSSPYISNPLVRS